MNMRQNLTAWPQMNLLDSWQFGKISAFSFQNESFTLCHSNSYFNRAWRYLEPSESSLQQNDWIHWLCSPNRFFSNKWRGEQYADTTATKTVSSFCLVILEGYRSIWCNQGHMMHSRFKLHVAKRTGLVEVSSFIWSF